jgi:hypothetical protein
MRIFTVILLLLAFLGTGCEEDQPGFFKNTTNIEISNPSDGAEVNSQTTFTFEILTDSMFYVVGIFDRKISETDDNDIDNWNALVGGVLLAHSNDSSDNFSDIFGDNFKYIESDANTYSFTLQDLTTFSITDRIFTNESLDLSTYSTNKKQPTFYWLVWAVNDEGYIIYSTDTLRKFTYQSQ